jgi:hypothetical protein
VIVGILGTYFAHANPALGNVDQKTVLCPFPCALSLFRGEICAVLLEVDLYNECYPSCKLVINFPQTQAM